MRKQKRTARWASSSLLILCVVANVHAASNAARDVGDSRISVTAVAGDVEVTMAGQAANVAPDSTVLLPSRIVTGHDGTLGLTQAGTNISVSNDTDVEIPAEAVDGNLIARLVQHRGNVFYDVAPRDLGKLRVETPLLVAVIKGTQFNVAVQPDSTTISLFEGRLEIRTPDGTDVVQLNAGEIAIRSRTDGAIRVVGMDDDRVAAPRTAASRAVAAALDEQPAPRVVDLTNAIVLASDGVAAGGGRAEVGLTAKPIVGGGLDLGLDAGTDIGASAAGTTASANVTLGGANVALDTGIDLGGGSLAVALTQASTWAAPVDVG